LRQAGSALFSQITGTFTPLREVLSKAFIRRSGDFWNRLSRAKALLQHEPLSSVLDPLPTKVLSKNNTFADAIKSLKDSPLGLIVVDETQKLWGTLDCNDLHQIVARVAAIPAEKRENISQHPLSEFLRVTAERGA